MNDDQAMTPDDGYRTPAIRRQFEQMTGHRPLGVGEDEEDEDRRTGYTELYRAAFVRWIEVGMTVPPQNCVACDAIATVTETMETTLHPYGGTSQKFSATYPVMTCSACGFAWSDYRGEQARDAAFKFADECETAKWSWSDR